MKELDQHEIVLRGRDSKFIAGIPQLDLYVQADSPQNALNLLEQKRILLANGDSDFGEFDDVRTQPSLSLPARKDNEFVNFAIKCAIAIGMSTATILGLIAIVAVALSPTLKSIKPMNSREILTAIEERLHRAAQPSEGLTNERKQKILTDAKIVAEKWGPFINDLLAILENQKKQ